VRSLVEPVHNERSALDARTPLCFHIEAQWPAPVMRDVDDARHI
jgi:hypothetical protein